MGFFLLQLFNVDSEVISDYFMGLVSRDDLINGVILSRVGSRYLTLASSEAEVAKAKYCFEK